MLEEKEIDNLNSPDEEKENETEETGEIEEKKEEVEEEKFELPDKFKGKSPEEIAKSYIELEKMIERKAEEKAEEETERRTKEREEELPEEPEEENEEEKLDFASMTPTEFAKWVQKEIDKRAGNKARGIYEESSKIKESVSLEISEAQKKHPLLKENPDYRATVLSIIEAGASRKETISLEKACSRVDTLIGGVKEVGEKEEDKLKKAKTIVEKGGSAPIGREETSEEESVRNSLLGGNSKSGLKGLGI